MLSDNQKEILRLYREILGDNWPTLAGPLKRTGISPQKNLRWLVKLAGLSLQSLTREQQVNLCEEVDGFTMLHASHDRRPPHLLAHIPLRSMREHDQVSPLGFGFEAGFQTRFKLVCEFQELARNALDSYIDKGYAELESIEVRPIVFRRGKQDFRHRLPDIEDAINTSDPVKKKAVFIKSERNLFISRLEFLLRTPEADNLRRCASKQCRDKIYVATKKDQRYCSSTCRTREAVRAKRLRDRQQTQLKTQQK
jgi:hypothetical protein